MSRGRRSTNASSDSGPSARAPRKRDKDVLEAAVKVFYERGYSNATIQNVADELGILKGSLYHYIDTKEDLLFRLFEEVHREVDELMKELEAVEGLEPIERLRLFVQRQVEYNLANLSRISIYYHDMDRLSPERHKVVLQYRRANSRFVEELIREAQEVGQVDPSLDVSLVTNCLFGTIIWTYRWYQPGGRASRQKIAEVCAAYAIEGLVGGAPRSGSNGQAAGGRSRSKSKSKPKSPATPRSA